MMRAVWWIALLTLLGACTRYTMPEPQTATLKLEHEFEVGVDWADITPPPGLSLFAHGPESRVATGTLLRLRCHAFVITDGTGKKPEAVALVPCELSQPSLVLQREVARRAQAKGVPLGADRIVLTATHTHAGPAHIFGSTNLSGPFSSRMWGFDKDLVEKLAEPIAGAISRAYNKRVPARLRFAVDDDVVGLTMNRAMAPFRLNDVASLPTALKTFMAKQGAHPDLPDAAFSVDPRLTIIRFDRNDQSADQCPTLGVLAVFGMHPTAIPNDNELYHGDVFGYATRAAARSIATTSPACPKVHVALANGIEGDVTPLTGGQSTYESRTLGHRLGEKIAKLWRESPTSDPHYDDGPYRRLRVAYRELDVAGAPVGVDGQWEKVCIDPALGAPASGGASDNPTSLRTLYALREGVRLARPNGCHGQKVRVHMPIGENIAGDHFPRHVPIAQIQLGGGILVTVPAEISTVAGLRLREQVELVSMDLDRSQSVAVIGLAHEYLQYVATREEYALQYYEGASTIYGPHSAELLTQQHRCLTFALLDKPMPTHCTHQNHHQKLDQVGRVEYVPTEVDRFTSDKPDAVTLTEERAPRFVRTKDGRIAIEVLFRGPMLDQGRVLNHPSMRIDVRCNTSWPGGRIIDTDDGESFEIRYVHADTNGNLWCALWAPTRLPPSCFNDRHFHIRYGTGAMGKPTKLPWPAPSGGLYDACRP